MSKKKEIVILDTNIFTNSASSYQFWNIEDDNKINIQEKPLLALINFLKVAKKTTNIKYLIPPSVYNELFVYKGGSAKEPFININKVPKDLLIILEHQAPKLHELQLPAFLFSEMIAEFHTRRNETEKLVVDRFKDVLGVKLSQKHQNRSKSTSQPTLSQDTLSQDIIEIRNLKDSFRTHMRHNIIDSNTDLDVILLAYQTGGYLVSSDEGVIRWSEKFGVKSIVHNQLLSWMLSKVKLNKNKG